MSDANDAASRTEEPTPRKLQRAREQGDVVKTPDLASLASLAAVAAVIAISGGALARNLAAALVPFLARADAIRLQGDGIGEVARRAMMAAAPVLIAVMAAAAFAGAAGNLVQTGLLFTPSRLRPQLSKLSPMAGLRRMVGPDGLVHFLKSLLKVAATGAIGWWVLAPHWSELAGLASLDPLAMLPFAAEVLRRLVFATVGFLLVVAGADWLFQRQRYMARMRMSKAEVKEDFRQSEGDPQIKGRQKQIRAERARRRMMQAVPSATVVVANPTHYAVALRYEQGETAAPICVAKGLDTLALKIRAVAEEAGVPVIEDPPLARALYAAVEVDEMIPQAHYQAVAKIIGFILTGARRARARAL
ncbi:MAG TPA: flagellar biosynthesis protein FlhB [Phenylobacterium sp.]|uniref:flagellar biosynthesis protein FlhB n=1 Tax=Phenylobacterium sp. TaxID=1871053 RepID=UPI002B777710|nr:flagellar biosynthesis protein FlhB [Phenylobacterium sp.]HSV03315.1 flagellar biosynthesis protein FlhB [Phenylobacterium sp.]